MREIKAALGAAQDVLTEQGIECGAMMDFAGDEESCDVYVEVFNADRCDWQDVYHVPLKKRDGVFVLNGEPSLSEI